MEVKARDLRIGNLVDMGIEGIVEVSGYNLYQKTIHENGGSVADYYSQWKPIPITEELLLKAGFECEYLKIFGISTGQPYTESYRSLSIDLKSLKIQYTQGGNGEACYWVYFNHIKYIHQLQNLIYSLTGSELTFKQ